ncbi:iron transport receptor [Novosphingobium sp. Rr 2-17]|uniref:TonB-dependent receptor n=1 Tax=Novosphingobium sp. Rr 2-17 TaxID=555793 RepID=UPI0002697EC4|nr:TonB-dependent receptor [Novosphingobium sp. Rr 2-17]EIZ78999.1 iron transport receptor [Novosphingobium sp. Rr 2-17]
MRTSIVLSALLGTSALFSTQAWAQDQQPGGSAPQAAPAEASTPKTNNFVIVVTASRVDMMGKAATASQGTITQKEVSLRPIVRPGQLFESIPGLVVTTHSGEGKANQYLIRGYNLDHGTDFANFVDDMPVNRPTNTHGQGYSDVNFLIPQVVSGIDYTKGPYYAAIGDFGAVASAHTHIANDIPTSITATVGTDDYQELFAGGTYHITDDQRLMGAVDASHYNGPWKPGLDFKKVNAILRYSQGDASDGFSLTGMYYKSGGGLITDQPERAIEDGTISRYGTLDPTDHSKSLRYSLSAHLDKPIGDGQLSVSLYGIHSTMELVNNFTHYLDDPVNGDQEAQDETRTTLGGAASYTLAHDFGGIHSETIVGLQGRYDNAFVTRRHTKDRTTILDYCMQEHDDGPATKYATVNSYCNADRVHLLDLAPYIQNTTTWTSWLRTVVGMREEFVHANDRSATNGIYGSGHQWLFQPKGSLILGPWAKTEFYFSAGRGFHSDDVRGVFGTVSNIGTATGKTPLLAQTDGYEFGIRSNIIPKVQLQLAVFQQDFQSELTYNADTGQDEAGAPSRRQGIEISGQYHPFHWLELNADLAFSKPRYHTDDLAAYGLTDTYIADAPEFIGSAGILIDDLGPWSASLVWRRLGKHHLADGEAEPTDNGYSEFNLNVGYTLPHGWKFNVGVYNLLDSKDAAADYYYTSRLQGEAADGVTGIQTHPLEPRSARFSITKTI